MAVERDAKEEAVAEIPRRLFHQNLGFLRDRRLRRILALAGHELRFGLPKAGDGVAIWGASPTAWRGEKAAQKSGATLVRIEDGFLRSLKPGRMGEPPLSLLIDAEGLHFDPARPSRIERILNQDPLDNSHLLARAKAGIARMRALHLSKYNIHDPDLPAPPAGYVLVVDQTAGDASLRASQADRSTFAEMLEEARRDHPHATILIKTHPETAQGLRAGHFGTEHLGDGIEVITAPHSPWHLLEGAIAVYTVSSQMGFEAILAGHRPHVWGQPFYAGWGLSHDRTPPPRRGRKLTRNQLFSAAMILAPLYYDPCRDRLCSFEEALDQLEAETRAYREDRAGYVASGMRLWKRGRLQAFYGQAKGVTFVNDPAKAERALGRRKHLIWAGKAPDQYQGLRVEDGLLRSRGLGAELVPPLSLVADPLGVYYDPSRPSQLETLLLAPLPEGARERAERLIALLREKGLTKYNLGGATTLPPRGARQRILVPGQVENDASILKGTGKIRSNLALLQITRAANPEAEILYKPHPDVEAGLRTGAIAQDQARALADHILPHADMAALLATVDEVWTMTSGTGFEALLRGLPVTTFGAPFYAGWGLTRDIGEIPLRRQRRPDGSCQPRPDLAHLVHAALIAYPRYWDPMSRRPCPVEVAIERLSSGEIPHPGVVNRLVSKAQGALSNHAWLWRT